MIEFESNINISASDINDFPQIPPPHTYTHTHTRDKMCVRCNTRKHDPIFCSIYQKAVFLNICDTAVYISSFVRYICALVGAETLLSHFTADKLMKTKLLEDVSVRKSSYLLFVKKSSSK